MNSKHENRNISGHEPSGDRAGSLEELQLMADYLHGVIDGEGSARLVESLRKNKDLARELAEYEMMDVMLRNLPAWREGRKQETAQRLMREMEERLRLDDGLALRVIGEVERNAEAERSVRRFSGGFVAWVAAAAACIAAVAGGLWLTGGGRNAADQRFVTVAEARAAWVVPSGADVPKKVVTGDVIRYGETIETDEGGMLRCRFAADSTTVELGESSTAVCGVSGSGGGQVYVRRGRVTAKVVKQRVGKRFVILTPHAVMTAVGTEFSAVVAKDSTRMKVDEGIVKMARSDGSSEVAIGVGQQAIVRQDSDRIIRPGLTLQRVALPKGTAATGGAVDGKRLWLLTFKGASTNGALVAMDTETGKIVERVEMKRSFERASSLAWDGTNLWGFMSGSIAAVDVKSGEIVRELPIPSDVAWRRSAALEFYDGSLWMSAEKHLLRVDPLTGKVVSRLPYSRGIVFLAVSGAGIFVSDDHSQTIHHLNLSDGKEISAFGTQSVMPRGDFALGTNGTLWIINDVGLAPALVETD